MMLKKDYMLFAICFFYISLVSCSSKEGINKENIKDTVNIIVKDTIYIPNESLILDDFLYLTIKGISIGDSWTDKQDKDFFYRLLFNSIGEMHQIYLEKIQILEEDNLKFINRIELSPEIFGLDFFNYMPSIIEWLSPTVVKLLIDKKEYNFDISKMKVV